MSSARESRTFQRACAPLLVMALAAGGAQPEPVRALDKPEGLSAEGAQDRYLTALETWVASGELGSLTRTGAEIADLLAEVRPRPGTRRELFKLQNQVVEGAIEECGDDCLLPLWALYQDVGFHLARRGTNAARVHAMEIAIRIEKAYLGPLPRRRGAQHRQKAARLLARQGLLLRHLQEYPSARRYLNRAVSLDDELQVALRSLGALQEKLADYGAAEATLSRLLELQPEDAEARLRWALCRYRSGAEEGVLATLEDLSTAQLPEHLGWVAVVALHQRVALLMEAGRSQEALAQVRAGWRRFPGDPGLAVQEAFLQPPPAPGGRAVAVTAVAAGAPSGPGSRGVYNAWPEEGLEELRVRVAEDLEATLPSLRQLLASKRSAMGAR